MAEKDSAHEGSIRTYLAQHGGSVEDAGGRGLTDEMARAIGVEKPAALSAILGQMEDDGVITREMRGLRTYRIALVHEDAPVAAAVAAEPAAVEAPADSSPRRALSLREAISQRTSAVATAPGVAPPEPEAGAPPPNGRPSFPRSSPSPVGAGDRPAGRAVSLRDAIAGNTAAPAAADTDADVASRWEPPPPTANFTSLRDTGRSTPPPSTPAWDEPEGTKKKKKQKEPRAKRARPRLSVPVPSVKAPPSTPIVTAVGIALAGLVLVTVITIVVSRGSTHHVPATGTPDSSDDACRVVTSVEATTAFGGNAGDPHFVLGSCVYDDGTHELIVEVARQNGRTLFDSSRSSSAKDIPGLGDSAYYADGRLRVLKGSTLMLITLSPFNVDTPNPKLLALAETATGRL